MGNNRYGISHMDIPYSNDHASKFYLTARSNISFDGPILFKEHVDDNMMWNIVSILK